MSQDKFDDPNAPRDVTILRPRPGAGRKPPPAAPAPPPAGHPPGAEPTQMSPRARGQTPAPPPEAAPPPPPPAPDPRRAAVARASAPAAPASISEFLGSGANPLLQAAVPLLVLAGRLRGQIAQADVEALQRQAIEEIRGFEARARKADIPAEDVLAARYALCTAIDEAVLNTPWGAQSGWAAQSLLVTFHREASGGEKFFQILDRVSGEPQRYLALLELLYVCLALGFEGKYRLDDRGNARLAEIREGLYRRIEGLRDHHETELSPRWKGIEDRRTTIMRFVPLWMVGVAVFVLLMGGFIFASAKLSDRTAPVNAVLAGVGLEKIDPATPVPNLPPSGLRELLAGPIAQNLVALEEQGGRTSITLTVTDLFGSGSTRINERYTPLIEEIGAALQRVPGRIVVVGHTDDQPLRSFRFKDNFELSRARAMEVATLLRTRVQDGARIEAAGKGSLEPRFTPADLPENRARNRRVEILHDRVL